MITIGFVNKKGGVGKTSCVMHVGGALALRGYRTLLVDVDAQASLSQGILGPPTALCMDPMTTIAGIFEGGVRLKEIVLDVGRPRLALVAGHDLMTDHNWPKPWTRGMEQFVLRDALTSVAADFDVCILDLPPHIQANAWNGLVASDGVILPAQPEDYGIQGIAMILDSVDKARSLANPNLKVLGILPTMVQKTLNIHSSYIEDVRQVYARDVFEAVIPAAKDFKEAVTLRRSVAEYKPKGAASKAVEAVVDEILARLKERCGWPASSVQAVEEERGAA